MTIKEYRDEHGLVPVIRPIFYGREDVRTGQFEFLIWDMKDIDYVGTKAFEYQDVGYKIHLDEDENGDDKLYETYEAAEESALKSMARIINLKKIS